MGSKTKQSNKLVSALTSQAQADKEKALMALDLLFNKAVGVGEHTSSDIFEDANKSLALLAEADDKLEALSKYFKQ
jgi:hypothetical protein